MLAYKQALQGTLLAGPEKEGELATMSLEFEYLHGKIWCEMLIGGDDMSNMMSLPLVHAFICFTIFVYIRTCLHLAEIWQLSQWRATGELEVEFKFQRHSCKLSFLFPPCTAARAPWRACSQASRMFVSWTKFSGLNSNKSPVAQVVEHLD